MRAAARQFQLCTVVRSAQGREQRLFCMSIAVSAIVQRERLCISRFCTRFCAIEDEVSSQAAWRSCSKGTFPVIAVCARRF